MPSAFFINNIVLIHYLNNTFMRFLGEEQYLKFARI